MGDKNGKKKRNYVEVLQNYGSADIIIRQWIFDSQEKRLVENTDNWNDIFKICEGLQ
jgi:hypothetical protein